MNSPANLMEESPVKSNDDSGSMPSWIEAGLDSIARLVARYSYPLALAWIIVVSIAMVGLSRQKPLWADEAIFRWITILPTTRDIWHALTLGLNTDPPLAHLLTHGLTLLFGSSPLIVRLASMAGVCAMLLCLFLTLRKYVGPLYALPGLILPFCTTLMRYGYEARPYGLMYGCIGVAIYSWVRAGEDRSNRGLWKSLLGVALAAMLACHFYAVFALPAFFLAEGVRSLRRNRVDLPTVAAILGASATLLFYSKIIAVARLYSSAYFAKPDAGSVPAMIEYSLQPILFPLFVFLILVAILAASGIGSVRDTLPESARLQAEASTPELAALALGFLTIPILGWLAGVLVLKAFASRYVLHGLIGLFLLIPVLAARAFRSNPVLGLALLASCSLPAVLFVAHGTLGILKAPVLTQDAALLQASLPQLNGDIVVSDPIKFVEMVNYSPELKARCIYIWDRPNEVKYVNQDTFFLFAPSAASMGWFRTDDWADYRAHHKTFLVLTKPDTQSDGSGWMRAYLKTEHRYGDVVMTVGSYLVVAAKPQEAGQP